MKLPFFKTTVQFAEVQLQSIPMITQARAFGGGVANLGGHLEVRDALFEGNTAVGNGGGIFNGGDEGSTDLTKVRLSQNVSGHTAGAIFNDADLNILRSEVIDNIAEVRDGGIFNSHDANVMVEETAFSGNGLAGDPPSA